MKLANLEKSIKSKTSKIYKNKKLNNANFGTYNLNDYQVFLQLISKIGGVDKSGKYLQSQQLERSYTLTALEFSKQFNLDIKTSYGVLKRAGGRLARTAITLQKPELNEIWDIAICSRAKYNIKEGSLTIEFNEHVMPYIAQVTSNFMLYNLKEIANFGSLYTTRLYELIQEWQAKGYIHKTIVQLRDIFAVGKKFSDYHDFKRRTFGHAVKEINSQYELNIHFEEIKEGRKVVAVNFYFTPTIKEPGTNPYTGNKVNYYIKPKPKIIPIKPKKVKVISQDLTTIEIHPNQQELPNLEVSNQELQEALLNRIETLNTQDLKDTIEVQEINQDVPQLIEDKKSFLEKSAEEVKSLITSLWRKKK